MGADASRYLPEWLAEAAEVESYKKPKGGELNATTDAIPKGQKQILEDIGWH